MNPKIIHPVNPGVQVVGTERIDLSGYLCPFVQANPIVVELPGLIGHYVTVFKELSVLVDAMRYLDVQKYKVEMIGNGHRFYELIMQDNAKIVINPKAYNGITIWDGILPMENNIIV